MLPLHERHGGNVRRLPETLTERQRQVAALVCDGLSNKLIARTLNVSEGTIKSHMHAIFGKLRLQSRLALIVALGRTGSD
jgi:two-component system nitrate/nitrite response regulator NarL